MMTEEQRIEWLLELQDHSEQLTDEQLQQIYADDEMRQLVQQLGFAKRAFKHDELKNDFPNVDDEWGNFVACHAEELDALDEGGAKPRFPTYLFTHKIAASFVGVLLASGIAFAAIQVVRTAAPYIFNNVPLDSMLTVIAAVHGVGVEFENDAARQLRFHFVWKREDSLSRVVEKLNTFEAVKIGMEGEKLLVR